MSYCHICKTECLDIASHSFSCHTLPSTANPGSSTTMGASSSELEPDSFVDDQTFCFQCSRDFRTIAALTAHLGDAQVHNRNTEYTAHMPSGTPGYPSHAYDATGSYSLYSRSPVSNYDHNYFVSGLEEEDDSSQTSDSHLDGSNAPSDSPSNHLSRECTPQDDQLSLYDASSAHQSPELSSEEITSENDEQDNPANTEDYEYYNHPRTTPMSIPNHIQYSRPPDSITGGIWSPNSPYTPGTNAFIHPLSNTPSPGMSAYVQEGMSISHPYPKSQLTPGMSYYHRSEATTGPDVYCAGASSSSALPPTPRIMCPICLDPAQEITSTLCGHIFCAFCIKSALSLREACPVCNRAISRWSTHPIYPVL